MFNDAPEGFVREGASKSPRFIERWRQFCVLLGVYVEAICLSRESRFFHADEQANLLQDLQTSCDAFREKGLPGACEHMRRQTVQSGNIASRDYRAASQQMESEAFARVWRSFSRLVGKPAKETMRERSLSIAQFACSVDDALPDIPRELDAAFLKTRDELALEIEPHILSVNDLASGSKATLENGQASGGLAESQRILLESEGPKIWRVGHEEMMDHVLGRVHSNAMHELLGDMEEPNIPSLFRKARVVRQAFLSDLLKICRKEVQRMVDDNESVQELTITICPPREGEGYRSFTLVKCVLVTLSGLNAAAFMSVIGQIAEVREAGIGMRTDEVFTRFSALIDRASSKGWNISIFSPDASAATDALSSWATRRAYDDLHWLNQTQELCGEFWTDVSNLRTLLLCRSELRVRGDRAAHDMRLSEWLRGGADLPIDGEIAWSYILSLGEIIAHAARHPTLYKNCGFPQDFSTEEKFVESSLQHPMDFGSSKNLASLKRGRGEIVADRGAAAKFLKASSLEKFVAAKRKRCDAFVDEQLFVGKRRRAASMSNSMVPGVLNYINRVTQQGAIDSENAASQGTGDDAIVIEMHDGALLLVPRHSVAQVLRSVDLPAIKSVDLLRRQAGFLPNTVKTQLSSGNPDSDDVGGVFAERQLTVDGGELVLHPSIKLRTTLTTHKSEGFSWWDPSGFLKEINSLRTSDASRAWKSFIEANREPLDILRAGGIPLHLPVGECGVGLPIDEGPPSEILRRLWTACESPGWGLICEKLCACLRPRTTARESVFSQVSALVTPGDPEFRKFLVPTPEGMRKGKTARELRNEFLLFIEEGLRFWLPDSSGLMTEPDASEVVRTFQETLAPFEPSPVPVPFPEVQKFVFIDRLAAIAVSEENVVEATSGAPGAVAREDLLHLLVDSDEVSSHLELSSMAADENPVWSLIPENERDSIINAIHFGSEEERQQATSYLETLLEGLGNSPLD
jgi:hypothetical protein